ncbi:CitMHS family transporter [Salinicola lusitanus]|uniref:Citrate:proton symporter n=1 Tax=Salinicola lusitanus TaxID=1949085 RepID=A0ABZ3CS38_9GAMM|nr:citrate:proton symporter [Salinicola lusitanus]
MLTIIGLGIIIAIVALLLTERVTPIIALSMVPLIGALIAGFGPADIAGFFESGLQDVANVAVMFIFAILFFGVLQDVGLFDPLINRVVAFTRGNVIAVAMGTGVIGTIAHLDGSGASTFLISIPALLPLYQRLRMSPYLLLLIVSASIGIMNLVPWAGPIGRAAAVTGISPTELWRDLLPVQIAGFVILMIFAALLGLREQGRIKRLPAQADQASPEHAVADAHNGKALPPRFWLNLAIAVATIGVLASGIMPPAYMFMLALGIVLLANYPKPKAQMERIKAHAPGALLMASIISAAGAFLGILSGTGMLESIATDLAHVLPHAMVPYLHLVIGVFGVPLDMLTSTDAYYFALLPVVEQVASTQGVAADSVVYAMTIGNNVGKMISPFSPAMWLALGLAGAEMGRHIRYSFFLLWLFSLVMLAFAYLIGLL